MNDHTEDIIPANTPLPSSDRQSTSSPTLSESQPSSSDLLGSDQATLSGGSYHSADSLSSSHIIATSLTNTIMASATPSISYKPPTNTTAPSASVLKHLTKLSTGNFVAWKRDLEIHLDACGLGGFIISKIPEPTITNDVPLWRMHRAQVLLAMRTTVDGHNLNAISGSQHPHDAMSILSRRHGHGENVGLAVANSISAIVFHKFDASMSIEEFISNTQSLHNELAELTTSHPGFRLSDEILALLLVIKLPQDSFNSIIQQLLSDLKNLTTSAVFDRLLTESQSMKPNSEDSTVALAAQQKQKKTQKGDRSSKEPSALCHLPSHSLSMHSNAECRTQNPSLQPNRSVQNPRPMGRTNSAPNSLTSRGLAAISALSDAEKARLFNHLHNAQANSAMSQSSSNVHQPPQESTDKPQDQVVYFANAYSAMAQSSVKSDDMVSDTGANRFIFHSLERFVNLRPISPVSIKTADGSCHLIAHYAGDALVKSFDERKLSHQMILPHTLYCPQISINLISASRLCDIGATFSGTSDRMVYINSSTGEQPHATRQPNSNDLWTVRMKDQTTCLDVSADLMHQRMGHLHSHALRRFCNDSSKSTTICTSCSLAKSHRHPFSSTLPKAEKILYRIHSDVVGPFQVSTPGGKRYFVTFIDEHSRFARVYLLARKDEVFKTFVNFLTEAERQTGQHLCILKSNRGGEYTSTQF